ncbi:MAG: UDP-N-acetylmuramoyl-L-alanine--D-glutamate ligase [Oligoflexia bacterium]|nr:UDP-N-acetylmuramoyl-L-alanine--D-glutamate ligase [Oligoflexia bacterium]
MSAMYANKKITIMGLSKSCVALAKLLSSRGAKVFVSEMNPKENVPDLAKELEAIKPNIEVEYGKHTSANFLDSEIVLLSHGVRMDTKPLDEVRSAGIPILSDVELLAREIESPIIAIAGTEGKTTVALLVKAFLEAEKKSTFFSGDHGEPLANLLLRSARPDFVILEMTPSQMDMIQEFRPAVTVLTALQPPFPEKYPSPEIYGIAMRNLLRNLDEKSILVYNFRDSNLKSIVAGNTASKRVYRRKDPSSLGQELANLYKGSWLASSGRELVWKGPQGVEPYTFDLRNLRLVGLHNKDNLMAAVNVAKELGVTNTSIQKVIDTIPGVPHRLEFVKKKGGVRLFNDSRTTTVDGLRRSLESFPLDPVILISGGRDAQADFTSLVDIVKTKVKTLILVGEAKEHINRCIGDYSETFLVGTFEEAILLSYQKSREGDIILLSPGCESYDMFVSYEERGNYFKKYVEEI